MSSSFLIEDNKYDFLKRLGIEKRNMGVYHNQWTGNGQVFTFVFKVDIQ